MKTSHSKDITEDLQEKLPVDFSSLESKVFIQQGNNIYIGGILVNDQMRGILRDQAKSFQTTNLFEILNATITNEAGNLALIQSANMEHVQYAKALHHWNHVLKNMIHKLAQ